MKVGEEITLRPEMVAFEGGTIARVDGMAVFVQGAVPGDEVLARIVKVKRRFAEAKSVRIVAGSLLRREPRCKYFGVCGGCKWQHVEYGAQLEFKRQHVIDALERISGFRNVVVNATLPAPETYFYRNKMEFSFGDRWLSDQEFAERKSTTDATDGEHKEEDIALGLHIPQRYDKVLDVHECWLQSENSNRVLNGVREFCVERGLSVYSTRTHTGYLRNLVIRESKSTGEFMVNIVTSDDRHELMTGLTARLTAEFPFISTLVNNITERKSQVAIGDREKVYHGPGHITERIGKNVYRISANSFFQTNTLQAERLYDTVQRMAQLRMDDRVFDLYCGIGTIALHVAFHVAEVVGIEAVEAAVRDAEANALRNNHGNCAFVQGDLKERLTKDTAWLDQRQPPTVMIIDPPRSGMHEKVLRQVLRLRPERIVYVSCNPATQARDLKLMCDDGSYLIREVQPVDMFPHTYHIENVVALSLADRKPTP